MPSPSCSTPPQRLRHSMAKTSAQPSSIGSVVAGDAAQEVHGRFRGGREALETGAIAPVAGDHDGEVRPLPGQPRRGFDQDIEALAPHEPADPDDHAAVDREAEPLASGLALIGRERSEAPAVDARVHGDGRQPLAGDPLRLDHRVVAVPDDQLGAPEHAAEQLAGDRHPAGHRDLGAVDEHGVRQVELGADDAEGQGRIEDDELRPELGGALLDVDDAATGSGRGSVRTSVRSGTAGPGRTPLPRGRAS